MNHYSFYDFECVQYEYFQAFIDFVAARSDSFSLETFGGRIIWSQAERDTFLENCKAESVRGRYTKAEIERVMRRHTATNAKNYSAEKMLEVPYYKVLKENYKNVHAIRLDSLANEHRYFFKLNADTIEYIKKRRNIYDFDGLYSGRLGFPHIEDKFYSAYRLENIAFYSNGKCVLQTVSHEGMVSIYDDEIHAKLSELQERAGGQWRRFVETWQTKRETLAEDDFVEYFVNSDYDYSRFMFPIERFSPKVAEKNSIPEKDKYWYSQTPTLARISCEKVERNRYAHIHDLFLWYGNLALRDFSKFEKDGGKAAWEEVVTHFLLNVPEEVFINGFKTTMAYLIADRSLLWKDKMTELWRKRGLAFERLNDKLMAEFMICFSEALPLTELSYKARVISDFYHRKYLRHLGKNVESMNAVVQKLKRRKTLSISMQCRLAYCYFYGFGTRQNYAKAAEFFSEAAERGVIDCQYDLARCYEQGLGVEKDLERAECWYKKAERNGYPKARASMDTL